MKRILDERDKTELERELGKHIDLADAEFSNVKKVMQEKDDAIIEMVSTHKSDTNNPHGVTKSQVGLGNVPNVDTNDQTPTYTEASALERLSSGERLSVAFSKISKAITDLIAHKANKENPHSVTAHQAGAYTQEETDTKIANVVDSAPETLDTLNELAAAIGDDSDFIGTINKALSDLETYVQESDNTIIETINAHTSDTDNPHGVTKAQVGLGDVPNVATNDQTPTYVEATTLETLDSGEKLSISMGKITKAIADLISHIGNTGNPHDVTAHQVGAYTQAETDTKIANLVDSAPETLNTLNELAAALGDDNNFATTMSTKLGEKATKDEFNAHKADTNNPHNVTVSQIGADALGSAAQALSDAKGYTDEKISSLGSMASKSIVAKSDLSEEIKTSLELADTSLQSYTETDPTVPDWAKQPAKPSYTALEVGALPDTTIALKNPNSIIFTGAVDGVYDGSEELTINIPKLPEITEEMEGKVLCVINGAYSFVSITDLIPNEEEVS